MTFNIAHTPATIKELEEIARQIRIDLLEMIYTRKSGHPGGSLSAADIITALFFHQMRIDPERPNWENRDRFILSKGHACSTLYAVLAKKGFFPEQICEAWGQIGCCLQGHPDRIKTPGVDMTSGCLGHGINIAAGLCLAARLKGQDYRTYVLLGDGEIQAGILWEGAMLAGKYKLDTLIAVMDYNRVQLDGRVEDIMPIEPVRAKWEAFNWAVMEIDGHNIKQIVDALDKATETKGKPTIIIASTVKGKGVSYMEGKSEWHGKVPSDEEFKQAMKELGKNV
jgi:transketolase